MKRKNRKRRDDNNHHLRKTILLDKPKRRIIPDALPLLHPIVTPQRQKQKVINNNKLPSKTLQARLLKARENCMNRNAERRRLYFIAKHKGTTSKRPPHKRTHRC